jgi:Flp pilus assembly protein TadD
MNKDNLLFTIIGLLSGFVLGYVAHEVMTTRQPARLVMNSLEPAPGSAPAGAAPAGGAPAAGMERVQQLRTYVEKNPNDAAAVRELANLNFDIGNWQRAAELYQQFLKLVPGDADVMTDLGACLRSLGQPQQAVELFRQALAARPDHWQARFNEVLVLAIDLRQLEAATASLAELQRLQPNNPEVARLAVELENRRRSS